MSVSLESPVQNPPAAPAAPSPQGQILLRVLAALEREQIPYCLLSDYEQYPRTIKSDVDILIPASYLPRKLAQVLHDNRTQIGAKVVQWFEDGAHFIVLAGKSEDGSPVLLQLHAATRYEMADRTYFSTDEILQGRRRHKEFWVPAPATEFACVLVNRVTKGVFNDSHGQRLTRLHALDPSGCNDQARRLFAPSANLIIEAASKERWSPVQRSLDSLKAMLLAGNAGRPAGQGSGAIAKKLARWIRPRNGFHAVFLGPDGVGKSTTIETFQRDLAPAFLSTLYLTFAPGLLPQKFAPPKPDGPHSLPPRSYPASLLKAAWWLCCYTLGYCATIRPTLARGGLVVNHRYLVDAIVDQKRYRYSGPVWLLRMIWAVAPKPDVVFLLDAAPEVIQRRKQEVTFAETAAQVQAYRNAIGKLPMGSIIDASQPREQVARQVEWLVLDRLADREARRMIGGGAA